MLPLLVLGLGLFLLEESSQSSSSAGFGSPGVPTQGQDAGTNFPLPPMYGGTGAAGGPGAIGGTGKVIEMTCDQALALLPPTVRPSVQYALENSKIPDALNALAQQLEDVANAGKTYDANVDAALLVVAHCLRYRADALSTGGKSLVSPAVSMFQVGRAA